MRVTLRKRLLAGVLAISLSFSGLGTWPVSYAQELSAGDPQEELLTEREEDAGEEKASQEKQEQAESLAAEAAPTAEEDDLLIEEETEPEEESVREDLLPGVIPLSGAEQSAEDLLQEETQEETAAPALRADGGDVVTGTLTISGSIAFDETLDGVSWTALVRPTEFDQPIELWQTYTDGQGQAHTVVCQTQDDQSKDPFYLKFTHDGQGGGDFSVTNVPKSVTADGAACQVTGYEVRIAPSLAYYTSAGTIRVDDPKTAATATGTLKLSLKGQKLTLAPTVVPAGADESAAFPMTAVFTNPLTAGTAQKELSLQRYPTPSQAASLQVPLGLAYSVTQSEVPGYQLEASYTVTRATKDDAGNTTETTETVTGPAAGAIREGEDVTVSTVNYAQNISSSFLVTWTDNHRADRPALTADNFLLQYRTAEGTWKDVTADTLSALGLSRMPAFDTAGAASGQYAFTGLPAVDQDKEALSYQVLVKTPPEGYTASYTDSQSTGGQSVRTFAFTEQTAFSADLYWNDDTDAGQVRPEGISGLNLYRRAGTSSYEQVALTEGMAQVTKDGSHWSISVSGLPRYDAVNEEYDYVLVRGTVDAEGNITQNPLAGYKTYYSNGTGSFGTDSSLCHNGGKITEVLTGTAPFSAKKEWKDVEADKAGRPAATVTLWRYVDSEAKDIDEAYAKGKAAQVVLSGSADRILSYSLDTAKDSATIVFDRTTVSGMTADDALPLYDDQGRKYVYFVRESLTGEGAEDYAVSYTDGEGKALSGGAPDGGTITNVRREKAAVTVKKIWRNPASPASAQDTKVTLALCAPLTGETDLHELTVLSDQAGSYEELTGNAKSAAQTASGFTASVTSGEVTYYVNLYDGQGRPYDMTKAVVRETVTDKEGAAHAVTYAAGDAADDPRGTLSLGAETYRAVSAYQGETNRGDGMKQFRYTQTNTITGTRTYTLVKEWASSVPADRYQDVQSVTFGLYRRSTGGTAGYKLAGTYQVTGGAETDEEGNTFWQRELADLPKYDDEGYAYDYRAYETGVLLTDGRVLTNDQAKADENRGWAVETTHLEGQTTALNYIPSEGDGYFTVAKTWQDNGDADGRRSVKARVYYRKNLAQALTALQKETKAVDTDPVNLDKLTADCQTVSLTAANTYFARVYFNDALYKAAGVDTTQDKSAYVTASAYLVLEYGVGESEADGAQAAAYTYGELKNAASQTGNYQLSGVAANKTRAYQVQETFSADSNQVEITNTRKGEVTLKAVKNWQDEQNPSGIRPGSVTFQLTRDGEDWTDLPESVTFAGEAPAGSAIDKDKGTVTLTGGAQDAEWTFALSGLPMFSEGGVAYTYDLEEETPAGYRLQKASPAVTGDGKSQTYAFSFTNTAGSQVSHIAYVRWQDAGVGAANRPDLYLTLWRYLRRDKEASPDKALADLPSWETYTAYRSQTWRAESTDTSSEAYTSDLYHGYNWKVTVEGLPRFNDKGQEYIYVFTEAMNNEGKTVVGTYTRTEETKDTPAGSAYDGATYEIFTNTITDEMTVKGLKTWTGLSGYQTAKADLPDPLISLYRTTSSELTDLQTKTEDEVNALAAAGTVTLVETAHLTEEKTRYAFPDASNVTDNMVEKGLVVKDQDGAFWLPKFDPSGQRYTYLVRESLGDGIASHLYTQMNINGTLTNVFRSDVNRRQVTVTKTWAGRTGLTTAEEKYPSVTYTLYRYELGREDSTTKQIASHQFSSADFTGEGGEAGYTFTDLLVYSPAGVQYGYYVTEKAIDGYSIAYTDEDPVAKGTLQGQTFTGWDSAGAAAEQTFTEEMLTALQGNARMDIVSLPDDWDKADSVQTARVSTVNTYDQKGSITLTGRKVWDDYGNAEGLRPEDVTLTLTRSTDNESGQSNAVQTETLALTEKDKEDPDATAPYIVWSKGTDPAAGDAWTYTIYQLERYAPNGRPYSYTLSEQPVKGYRQADPVTALADSEAVIMTDIANSFAGTYTVRKNWMDGSNKYNLRPQTVTVILQRSSDGGKTWSDVPWQSAYGTYDEAAGTWKGLPGAEGRVAIDLSAGYVMSNTRGNSWTYTFRNLPTENKAGAAYTYRCQEAKIGGVPLTEKTAEGETKLSAGSYACAYTTINDQQTVIENTLDSTSLYVVKTWEGDQEDLYHTRPDEVTCVLQKRGIRADAAGESQGGLSDWQNVTLADGSPYTFTLTRAGGWTATLEDLPIAQVEVGSDGTETIVYSLYFRAVEVHADDAALTVKGAQNYRDVTDYAQGSAGAESPHYNDAHYYDADEARNESHLTNLLILEDPAPSAVVNKTWYRQAGEEKSAVFELLYQAQGETAWHCFGGAAVPENGDWSAHGADQGCLQQTLTTDQAGPAVQSARWTGLPKADREGRTLSYRVVEHPLAGYETTLAAGDKQADGSTVYAFTNTQLQSYTVEKSWQNEDYGPKTADGSFTASLILQQRTGTGEWSDVADSGITLTTQQVKDTLTHTWTDLPMYDSAGNEITYRARETAVNGTAVNGTAAEGAGGYAAAYQYAGSGGALSSSPAFGGAKTKVENRMVYGFVDLSKEAAYLAPQVKEAQSEGKAVSLAGITFDIYAGSGENMADAPYVSGIKTDENGHLIRNENGTYGTEGRYLIAGTYTLKESSAKPGYSLWDKGAVFTVGSEGGNTDTGEHGTAWISTAISAGDVPGLSLSTAYLHSQAASHTYGDACVPLRGDGAAYNLESRGVITFTKTQTGGTALDTHGQAQGDTGAYFGVYLDEACTRQAAGLVPSAADKAAFVLTDKDKEGNALTAPTDGEGIPYLREYGTDSFTLLSGTYYLKELSAPAGYKADGALRQAVIAPILSTSLDTNLSGLYPANRASIMLVGDTRGTTDYQWENAPNVLKLYKRDQYGRKVQLKENGYLLLTVSSGTFPTGENTITLRQSAALPAAKADGTTVAAWDRADQTAAGAITYDEKEGCWTITGLFDRERTYTVSEPDTAVPDNSVVAKPFSFTMGEDGTITPATLGADGVVTEGSADAAAKDDPLKADGQEVKNAYSSGAEANLVVLRDTARYLKDVELDKRNTVTSKAVPNISFTLYKYDSLENGKPKNAVSVLEDGVLLTTDEEGKILLSAQEKSVKNLVTGCALAYGLDVGNYYFHEAERGASDSYRLGGDIFFKIEPARGSAADYSDYARVVFDTAGDKVSQTAGTKTGTVKNDPVSAKPKTLLLMKQDAENGSSLAGARFTLSYTSLTAGQTGSGEAASYPCVTGEDGQLYLADKDGTAGTAKPDISRKGTYTLTETAAAPGYMTPTDEKGVPRPMATFTVDSQNQITDVSLGDGKGNKAADGKPISYTIKKENGEDQSLNLTVTNEKTKVLTAKRSDIVSGVKTKDQKDLNGEALTGAALEIYQGTEAQGNPVVTLDGTKSDPQVTLGLLREGQIYTLHEASAPTGYLAADDLSFRLSGTRDVDGVTLSRLLVWTGTGKASLTAADGWSETANLSGDVLTMVDEAVIAPVDARKVLEKTGGTGAASYEALAGARFAVKAGEKLLGEAVSGTDGYLVWASVTDEGASSGLLFTAAGERVTSPDAAKARLMGKTIILRQNDEGYTFTETYAPDEAYNDGAGYTVKITAANYLAYRRAGGYRTDRYIDLKAANKAADHTVSELTVRNAAPGSGDLVNPAFHADFRLLKYDAESPKMTADKTDAAKDIGLPGVTFTLSRKQGETYEAVGDVTTGENGLLSISLDKKGDYQLTEKTAPTGYQLSSAVMAFTVTDADQGKILTYDGASDGASANHTVQVTVDEASDAASAAGLYCLPNARMHGQLTLTKTDADTHAPLSGVTYTLTRTAPAANSLVDGYFPSNDVPSLTLVTGKTYGNIAGAKSKDQITVKDGEAGVLTVEDLQWGTYTLTETTELPGYVKEEQSWTFTVDGAKGELTFTKEETNRRNSVTFYKTNQLDAEAKVTDLKPLAGAVFQVHEGDSHADSDTAVSFYPSSGAADAQTQAVSGQEGAVTVYGLPTDTASNTPKTYHLTEVTAPKGYKLHESVAFTLDRQGNVQLRQADGTYAEAAEATVTMADEPIKLYIRKLGETGEAGLPGAAFTLADNTAGEKLADGTDSVTVTTGDGGRVMIPIEKVIGGHTYRLTEEKAPEGYECTAAVTFTVKTDGTVEAGTLTSEGGYRGVDGNEPCAFLDTDRTMISLRDEKIRGSLTKVDSADETRTLEGAEFTLTPREGSVFADGFDFTAVTGLTYDGDTKTCTFTTGADGRIDLPEGLLVHGDSYLLRETKAPAQYYLSHEAKDGVILQVQKDGTIVIGRLASYEGRTVTGADGQPVSSCPASANGSDLTFRDSPSASFAITKLVEGNMGDLGGTYQIRLKAREPDGTPIGERTLTLKKGDLYDSETGGGGAEGFGESGLPVGAVITLTENNDLDYEAVLRLAEGSAGDAAAIRKIAKGEVEVTLKTADKVSLQLVNTKNVTLDVGVASDAGTPLAVLAFLIPAAYLALRARRKRKGGEE